jgi:hypothetical protein
MATLELDPFAGQSLILGTLGTPAISTSSENANCYAIDGPTGNLSGLFRESSAPQRPGMSATYRIADANPGQRFAELTYGKGAQTIAQLSKGGASGMYELLVAGLLNARNVEVAAGGTVALGPAHFVQGEQDQINGTSIATYVARAIQYRLDLTNDVGTPLGMAGLVPLILSQTATWASYGSEARIGLAQLKLAREVADFYALAQYQFPYAADGIHMTRVGYYKMGELHGRVHNAVRSGAGWKPFAPYERIITPTSVILRFDVPHGPLAIDTTVVPAQPNYGFSLAGTAATITGVAITAPNEVTLATSQQIVEPGATVGYGIKYGTGPGLGNLRDSEPTRSKFDNGPLANWALHFSDDLGIPLPSVTKLWVSSAMYSLGARGALYDLTVQP